jgi:outer membrane protein
MTRLPYKRLFGAITIALAAAPEISSAQQSAPLTVSLADAIRMAAGVSHLIRTAEAGRERAQGQQAQAKSQYYPQVNAAVGYQRTIQSQFQEISKQSSSTSTGSGSSGGSGGSNDFGGISKIFASPVTETMTLNFSQNVFTAGKVEASNALAEAARTAAEIGLDAAKAQMALDVAQAYFDAVAAGQVASIADSTLAQAERSYTNTNLAFEVGSASEFDLLRARVARDNQKPVVIQSRGTRDIALLRLRQLLGIPLSQPLALSTPIRDQGSAASTATLDLSRPIEIPGTGTGRTPDTTAAHRATVRQAEAAVEAQNAALRAAKWSRLPSVAVTSTYQRFGYPDGGFVPNSLGQFYPNWTATVGLSFPLFSGGRLAGERMVAQANLAEAEENLAQAKEFAALDARTATVMLDQAQSAYAASVGTDEQAAKAYRIAEVRQQEGISTQVELQQARTQYEQARLNRVIAAKDLEVARMRVALLKDLPLTTTTTTRRQ